MSDTKNVPEQPKFFGRRKGRVIRKAKSYLLESMLPQLRISQKSDFNAQTLFGEPKKEICLEIGFGDGQHIYGQAKQHHENGYVGVEVFQNGVANLMTLISGIKEGSELPQEIDAFSYPVNNIRVFDDDVRLLFNQIPDAFFDKVFLLFPDPWPKKKHEGRRFVNPNNLRELARLLKKNGILQIATDHAVYKGWVLHTMAKDKNFVWTAKSSDDWRLPPADWFETKYQRKAVREGRKPVFFEYQRV